MIEKERLIKAPTITAEEVAEDDYVLIDSPTLGTRKYLASKLLPEPEPIVEYIAEFTGRGYIELPYTLNENYKITLDYEINSSSPNNMAIIGNSNGGAYCHLTIFSSAYYNSDGINEFHFGGSEDLIGRHIYEFNNNGQILFDGVVKKNSIIPYTDNSINYYIGGRIGAPYYFRGLIHSYKIEDVTNGDTVCHIIPTKYNNQLVFRDIVNGVNYSCEGMVVSQVFNSDRAFWDFSKSLKDEINGYVAYLGGNASRDSTGVTISGSSGYVLLFETAPKFSDYVMEINFGDIIAHSGSGHGRFIMQDGDEGFIFRNNSSWQVYSPSWYSNEVSWSDVNNATAFANSTIVLKYNNSRLEIYKDDILIYKSSARDILPKLIGSDAGQSFYNVTIKAIKIYANEEV